METFWAILKASLLSNNYCGYFWTMFGKKSATFYFNFWSHLSLLQTPLSKTGYDPRMKFHRKVLLLTFWSKLIACAKIFSQSES